MDERPLPAALRELLALTQREQSVELVGAPELARPLLSAFARATAADPGSVLIRLSGADLATTRHDGIFAALDQLLIQAAPQPLQQSLVAIGGPAQPAHLQLDARVRLLNRSGLRLITMIESIEPLIVSPLTDPALLNGLRALASRHRLCYVVSAGRTLADLTLTRGDQSLLGSPFFNIFAMIDTTQPS